MYLKLSKHEKTVKNRIQRYIKVGGEYTWDDSGLLLLRAGDEEEGVSVVSPKKQGLCSVFSETVKVERWNVHVELHPLLYQASTQAPIFPKVLGDGWEGQLEVKLKLFEEVEVPYVFKLHLVPVGLA